MSRFSDEMATHLVHCLRRGEAAAWLHTKANLELDEKLDLRLSSGEIELARQAFACQQLTAADLGDVLIGGVPATELLAA